MLIDELKQIDSSPPELKKFGFTVGFVFTALGIFFLWRGKSFYAYPLVLGFFLLAGTLTQPVLLKPVQKVWMGGALILGTLVTFAILTALFYLVITPIGIIGRLFRYDFLIHRPPTDPGKSNWVTKDSELPSKEHYERQY
jgi:hypothetical protein